MAHAANFKLILFESFTNSNWYFLQAQQIYTSTQVERHHTSSEATNLGKTLCPVVKVHKHIRNTLLAFYTLYRTSVPVVQCSCIYIHCIYACVCICLHVCLYVCLCTTIGVHIMYTNINEYVCALELAILQYYR